MKVATHGVRRVIVVLAILGWSLAAILFTGNDTDALAWGILGAVTVLLVVVTALSRRVLMLPLFYRPKTLDERQQLSVIRAGYYGTILIAAGVGLMFGAHVGFNAGANMPTFAFSFGAGEMVALLLLTCYGSSTVLAWLEPDPPPEIGEMSDARV